MQKLNQAFPDIMKRSMKHFVKELGSRDDFKVRISKFECSICKGNAEIPVYQIQGQQEWKSVISRQDIKCKECADQNVLANILLSGKSITQDNLKKRFEKEYWDIPNDLQYAGFKNFKVDDNNSLFEAKRATIDYVKTFIEEDPIDRHNLLIMGNPGTGKTHLATAIARTIRRGGYLTGFVTTGRLLAIIQSTFNKNSMKTKEDIYRDIGRFDLLVLDDLGSEAKSKDEYDWSKKELFEIVNRRNGKPTIYTSNYNEKHLPTAIGERVSSRLYNNTKFIELNTNDYRKKFKRK